MEQVPRGCTPQTPLSLSEEVLDDAADAARKSLPPTPQFLTSPASPSTPSPSQSKHSHLSAKHAFGSRNGFGTAPGVVRESPQAKTSAPYLCLLCWPLSRWVSAVPGTKGDPESAGREGGLVSTRHRVGPQQQRARCSRHSHTRKAVGHNPETPLIHPDVPGTRHCYQSAPGSRVEVTSLLHLVPRAPLGWDGRGGSAGGTKGLGGSKAACPVQNPSSRSRQAGTCACAPAVTETCCGQGHQRGAARAPLSRATATFVPRSTPAGPQKRA